MERVKATWRHKGMYGNGSAFAPFADLYECSKCHALSVELFDKCPKCKANMKKGAE